ERLGTIKPLLLIDNEPALARVIRTVKQTAVKQIIVVLGYAADEIMNTIDLSDCRVVINQQFKTGMSSSLRVGIESLSPRADGFLILLGDMPYISSGTIRTVVAAGTTGALIVAPHYHGQRGFPVYLHKSCSKELIATLTGDIGARDFIAKHQEQLLGVEVNDPGTVRDIDRPKTLGEKKRG
ncbi:MAG: nucleotidyltransferase family protein, partial [Candidatus Bipolaricaulota bacterium]